MVPIAAPLPRWSLMSHATWELISGIRSLSDGPTARFPAGLAARLRSNTQSLYVLSRDSFTSDGARQFKCTTSVTPIAEIPVTMDDFVGLGGTIEFVEGESSVDE